MCLLKKSFIGFLTLFIYIGLNANEISIKTENFPPYSMEINGEMQGLSVNVLEAMHKQMGTVLDKSNIELISWSEAYSFTLENKHSMLFSTIKTPSREKLFKWVGPIADAKIGLISLKDRDITIKKDTDLNSFVIGSVKNDIGETLLLERDFDRSSIDSIDGTNSLPTLFYKLERSKIDMISYDVKVALYSAELNGYDKDEYEMVYELGSKKLYFAFNIETPDEVIVKWQKALDEIKSNGVYENIIKNY